MRVLNLARKVWNFASRGDNPRPSPNRPDDPTGPMGWIHPYPAGHSMAQWPWPGNSMGYQQAASQ